jgi:hypothetical protein
VGLMTPAQIVNRLRAGQRKIAIRMPDERRAMSLYNLVQAEITLQGLGETLDVCVRLAPEMAIVCWEG